MINFSIFYHMVLGKIKSAIYRLSLNHTFIDILCPADSQSKAIGGVVVAFLG